MAKGQQQMESTDAVSMDAVGFLKDLAKGDCLFDLSKGIEKVVKGVRDTGKKGRIELKVSFEPFKDDVNRVIVGYTLKAVPPPEPRAVSMFFSTVRNTLQRRDPNQVEFGKDAGFPE
jgi:hypothetical protein